MSNDMFEKRERAFEAVFFAKLDEQRIQALRAKRAEDQALEQLARTSGIADQDVLKKILDSGVDATTLEALSLVPLVVTAWANGEVTPAERDAALQAAEKEGIARESGAHDLLESWLDADAPPAADLEETWATYLRAVLEHLDDEQATALKEDLLSRCRQVARASGGFLGIGQISHAESSAMKRLAAALD